MNTHLQSLNQEQSIQLAIKLAPHRNASLFTDFLPRGYALFELDSISPQFQKELQLTKLQLGILITLLDDLVDHPKLRNPLKLKSFFMKIGSPLVYDATLDPLVLVYNNLKQIASRFPNFHQLEKLFDFDFESLKQAYLYSDLVYECPFASNQFENRRFVSHNMGILLALTLDLMTVPSLCLEEIPKIRELFYDIQETTRIMNILMSAERETKEEDLTSEIFSRDFPLEMSLSERIQKLKQEKKDKLMALSLIKPNLMTFDFAKLISKLKQVNELHNSYEGIL